MENKLIQSITQSLAFRLNRYIGKEGLELKKMLLGIEIVLINATKLIIMYSLALLLGILFQTFVLHTAYILIKRYSFGLHALNTTVCTLVSCLMFVIAPWFLQGVGIDNVVVIATFLPVITCLYRYAPADTKARPIIGAKLRKQLKRNATICGVVLMCVTLLVPTQDVKLLLSLGAVYQCIAILPLTYKMLKRSEKNYETYEQRKASGQACGLEG